MIAYSGPAAIGLALIALFGLAVLVGKVIAAGHGPDLHEGATERERRRDLYDANRDQEAAANAEFWGES